MSVSEIKKFCKDLNPNRFKRLTNKEKKDLDSFTETINPKSVSVNYRHIWYIIMGYFHPVTIEDLYRKDTKSLGIENFCDFFINHDFYCDA